MKKRSPLIILLVPVLLAACSTVYFPQSLRHEDYQVKEQPVTDSTLIHLLSPYSSRLNVSMNEVVGEVRGTLEKKQPECSLGNLMVDAMLYSARKKFSRSVDIAVVNYGGIRLNEIPPGPITLGTLYELSPFDNYIVLLEIKGSVLQEFLDHTASRGGWPVAGMSLQIVNKKATQVMIGGKPLNSAALYTIALVDYVANGGDESTMLKNLPQLNNGYLFRNELHEYLVQLKKEGRTITASTEGRVTNG
jgi:2',3'-cyclic-nucleotide 2'-phosphodiesterase (5'-nucleotidase family)